MYIVEYVDNQGIRKEPVKLKASCFTNAVMEAEKLANEIGHGMKYATVTNAFEKEETPLEEWKRNHNTTWGIDHG